MDECDLLTVATTFGTPLYVYELSEIRERAAELMAALPAHARVLYSLKANPLAPLVQEIRLAGSGAEVSSLGELDVAVAAGFDPADILYTGPAKSAVEIEAALVGGARLFSVESDVEMSRVEQIGRDVGHPVEVLLRLQPATGPTSRLTMTGGRQFGFEPDEAVAALRSVRDHVSVAGFHVYSGSQIGIVDDLAGAFDAAVRAIDHVSGASGVVPRIVDLGGGFPWPYAVRGRGCALDGLCERLDRMLSGWAHGPDVVFETGRRVVASAGHLLTTVVDLKQRSDGTVVVVLDAGINVLGGMSGLGRVMRPRTAPENLSRRGADPRLVTAEVVGPLCTPLDRLAARTEIADPRIGDVLSVPNVGAYGLTASLVAFLGRAAPQEIVLDEGDFVGAWRLATRFEAVSPKPAAHPDSGPSARRS